jgi:O-antigen ligase
VIGKLAAPSLARTDLRVVVLASTLPLLLLNPDHVPVLVSAAGVEVRPSDLAILLVVVLGLTSPSDACSRRAARRWLWLAPFLALLVFSAARVPDSGTVMVGVLKLAEYAAFGVAATVLLRRRCDLRMITASLVCCAVFFALVGVGQQVQEHQVGVRVESLTGTDPLGLLGATVLVVALAGPGFFGSRAWRRVAAAAGVLCLLVSASISATLAILCAAAFAAVRRLGPFAGLRGASLSMLAVATVATSGALVAIRWSDLRGAADQISAPSYAEPRPGGSLVQRAMFADFGARIWLDHPVLGVGFQQTPQLREWTPYFASVRADFPGLDVTYFPPVGKIPFGRPMSVVVFGLHNVYSQLLAETGLIGLLLFATGFAGFAGATFRGASRSEVAFVGSLLALGVLAGFTNNELYGGLPATTIFAVALAVGARGGAETGRQRPRRGFF